MNINWSAFLLVLGTSLGAVVAVVGLFSLGVLGLSQHTTARAQGNTTSGGAIGAGLAFLACAAIVAYGVYLIVAK